MKITAAAAGNFAKRNVDFAKNLRVKKSALNLHKTYNVCLVKHSACNSLPHTAKQFFHLIKSSSHFALSNINTQKTGIFAKCCDELYKKNSVFRKSFGCINV